MLNAWCTTPRPLNIKAFKCSDIHRNAHLCIHLIEKKHLSSSIHTEKCTLYTNDKEEIARPCVACSLMYVSHLQPHDNLFHHLSLSCSVKCHVLLVWKWIFRNSFFYVLWLGLQLRLTKYIVMTNSICYTTLPRTLLNCDLNLTYCSIMAIGVI